MSKPTPSMRAIAALLSFDGDNPRRLSTEETGFTAPTVRTALTRMHEAGQIIRVIDGNATRYYLTSVARSDYPTHPELAPAAPAAAAPAAAAPATEPAGPAFRVREGLTHAMDLKDGALVVYGIADTGDGRTDVLFSVLEVFEADVPGGTDYVMDLRAICDVAGRPRHDHGRYKATPRGMVRVGELTRPGCYQTGLTPARVLRGGLETIMVAPEGAPGAVEGAPIAWKVTETRDIPAGHGSPGSAVRQLRLYAVCDGAGLPRNDTRILNVEADTLLMTAVTVVDHRPSIDAEFGAAFGVFDLYPTCLSQVEEGATVVVTDVSEACGATYGYAAKMNGQAWIVTRRTKARLHPEEKPSYTLWLKPVCALDGGAPAYAGQLVYSGPGHRPIIACTALPRPSDH